jgi:hypothetical protein
VLAVGKGDVCVDFTAGEHWPTLGAKA